MKAEEKYYESDTFWNPANIKPEESKRIADTYKLLPKEIKSIADIGCGNGIFANYVKNKNKKISIIGVDESESALKYVQTNKKKGNITSIPLKDKEYDLTTVLEVIEHLSFEDYELAIKELARISKKYILVSVPNNEKLQNNFIECPQCHTQFSRSFHKRSFNQEKLDNLFSKEGFNCKYVKLLGERKDYIIISFLYRLLRRYRQRKSFNGVLICPVCNYSKNSADKQELGQNNKSKIAKLTRFIKTFWPKYVRYKWLVALYVRV